MKPGSIIHVEGRGHGTLVYNSLDGEGIVWGFFRMPVDPQWGDERLPEPDALLRAPFRDGYWAECIGERWSEWAVVTQENAPDPYCMWCEGDEDWNDGEGE